MRRAAPLNGLRLMLKDNADSQQCGLHQVQHFKSRVGSLSAYLGQPGRQLKVGVLSHIPSC